MRPQVHNLDIADADLTRFASNVTGATWTLTNTTTSDGLAHQVTIKNDAVTDHSAKTAAIVGLDANGSSISETVSLPGPSATVTSTRWFKQVTSVTPSATIGGDTMDIGQGGTVVSPWVPLDYIQSAFTVGYWIDVTGTINVTVQHTPDSPADSNPPAGIFADATLAAKTADSYGSLTTPARGSRLLVNSYSTGAEVKFTVLQGHGDRP